MTAIEIFLKGIDMTHNKKLWECFLNYQTISELHLTKVKGFLIIWHDLGFVLLPTPQQWPNFAVYWMYTLPFLIEKYWKGLTSFIGCYNRNIVEAHDKHPLVHPSRRIFWDGGQMVTPTNPKIFFLWFEIIWTFRSQKQLMLLPSKSEFRNKKLPYNLRFYFKLFQEKKNYLPQPSLMATFTLSAMTTCSLFLLVDFAAHIFESPTAACYK